MWFYIFVVLFAHHISTQISLGPSPSTMVCRGWNGAIGEAVTDLQELLPRLLGPLHAEETDLEGAMEELRNMEMEDEILEQARDQFLR